jgi:DNA-binding NtrC family response regulator
MGRALVVDDDSNIRLLLETILQEMGYEVVSAPNALEGFAALDQQPDFEILITDLLMPLVDGSAFIRRVKQEYPSLPILVASAYLEGVTDTLKQNAIFLRKPFSRDQFVNSVKQTLAAR